MASLSGFLRKAPPDRLQAFFQARGVTAPDDFDWSSNGRGKKFVQSIESLVSDLPDRLQDRLRAELDHLRTLADSDGMKGAEEVCAGQGIDLDGLQGNEDVLLMLAVDYPQVIDRVSAQTSLIRHTGGRNWAGFQFKDDGRSWALDDEAARDAFLQDAVEILKLPEHRKREADWYQSIRIHPVTSEETTITQATIYVEERAASELAFVSGATVERQVVPKVLEVGLACDPQSRMVEICAKGGKRVGDQYAEAFTKRFAPHAPPPVEVPRREVLLYTLRGLPRFETDPADGIEGVEVSSLEFFSTGGGTARFERRGDDETIYEFLGRRFGPHSPLQAYGWTIYAATLRIKRAARDGTRGKTLTVTLRAPNTTTLPNTTEADRHYALDLLERWGVIAPPPEDVDVTKDF
ncbi:hypothetical protein ROJ8625_02010 [Roseivivax jejudonensis]|uniref:Uncharacterized protein n=1 Tax=Roseivivax jejudonensis TaxID=1529041 RepID=A0A1X6Z675_9RHOB|nr:hypothetical protein [Roseivivax jejudonensis]SLN41772.1 hypothetical protein ROJ8625_02010 [Roseivivax jejudonensis]